MPGKVVRVAKIPEKEVSPLDADELAAEVCYYYQQYTFAGARQLPYKRVMLLLSKARQLRAQHYHNLVQIASAPHTENGQGVSELLKHFESQARHG